MAMSFSGCQTLVTWSLSSFEDSCRWQDVLAPVSPYLCRLLEKETVLPPVVLKNCFTPVQQGLQGIKETGTLSPLPEPEEASS